MTFPKNYKPKPIPNIEELKKDSSAFIDHLLAIPKYDGKEELFSRIQEPTRQTDYKKV